VFLNLYILSRPDSDIFGDNVAAIRQKMGRKLAEEHPVEADIVIPVPDSGRYAALGYSYGSGIQYEEGLLRNHYVGRTFYSAHAIIERKFCENQTFSD